MKSKTDWFPPKGMGLHTCEACPFLSQCREIEAHPNGIIGLGCEVLRLDERPDQFERDSVVIYASVGCDRVVRLADGR